MNRKILFSVVLHFFFIVFSLQAVQPIYPNPHNRTDQRKGDVAIAMMFQNEAPFLAEWIAYHKCIHVSHFYLYNHASTDNFWEVLQPYVESGEVELFDLYEENPIPEERRDTQRAAYSHALQCARGKHEWIAFIDSDECICMTEEDDIREFLKNYLYTPGLAMHWVMYGSSYVEDLEQGELQMEKLLFRAPDESKEHFFVKSIVRPQFVTKADIHTCTYSPGLAAVHPNHNRFSHTPNFMIPPIDKIRINHYWWRTEKYFREVKRPRRQAWGTGYSSEEWDALRHLYNSVYDPVMLRFVDQVKQQLKRQSLG